MASKVFEEDMEQIISDPLLPWMNLRRTSVLVTGATGLIGSVLTKTLRTADERFGLELRIIELDRRTDIRKPIPTGFLPEQPDYIFHCAAITRSAEMVKNPVDVITTSVLGTRNILDLTKTSGCRGMVYLSSMEVYGQLDFSEVMETDLGFLDLSSPRSSYPESKRLCENLCVAYNHQHDIPVKVARLAQTFGAGIQQNDTRVFAQFARSVIAGNDIILHTQGNSRGNYCYISDTIRALLLLLFKGECGGTYNIANPDASMTIREMAELVANEVCGGKISARIEPPADIKKCGYAPDVGYRINADKLKALGWNPKYGLADMYKRMLRDWRNE